MWFSNKNEVITKILSTKPFVGIGLISYSLYLWHYPIFAFAREIYFFEGIEKKFVIGIITLILSIFSYYFVEKIFRNKKNKFRMIIPYIAVYFIFLFNFNFSIIFKEGFTNRFSSSRWYSIFN